MKVLAISIMSGILFLFGCGPTDIHVDWANRPTSFKISIQNNPSADIKGKRLALESGVKVSLDITALSAQGMGRMSAFSKWVHIYARPGRLKVLEPKDAYNPPKVLDSGAYVYVKDGNIDNVKVEISNAFGNTRIWVEDNGYLPPTAAGSTAECADGKDNNGNDMIDLKDPGCLMANDHSEDGGTGASGVSDILYFVSPRLSDVQGHSQSTPFTHEEVDVTRGFMVVTRITNSGFYVTDIEDTTGYNNMYVYSYHMPADLRVCDVVTDLRGTVSEFYGFTELNFPSWSSIPWDEKRAPCYVGKPKLPVLQPSDIQNRDKMESLEAGVVRLVDVTTGDTPKLCDLNGDGKVNYCSSDPSDPECQCSTTCTHDPYCTDSLNYKKYAQWAAVIHDTKGGNPTKVWVISQQAVPQFDPFKNGGRRHISSITGTLKEFQYLKPYPWIIEVRCPDDIVIDGNPKEVNKSCINPRTGAIDAPN